MRRYSGRRATSNITPMLGAPIVGNFVEPIAERIHDELHARCLVLRRRKTQLAFAVCDNVGSRARCLTRQAARARLDGNAGGEHADVFDAHTLGDQRAVEECAAAGQ